MFDFDTQGECQGCGCVSTKPVVSREMKKALQDLRAAVKAQNKAIKACDKRQSYYAFATTQQRAYNACLQRVQQLTFQATI